MEHRVEWTEADRQRGKCPIDPDLPVTIWTERSERPHSVYRAGAVFWNLGVTHYRIERGTLH